MYLRARVDAGASGARARPFSRGHLGSVGGRVALACPVDARRVCACVCFVKRCYKYSGVKPFLRRHVSCRNSYCTNTRSSPGPSAARLMDAAARALSAAARSLSSLLGPERRLKFVEEAAMRAVREIWSRAKNVIN